MLRCERVERATECMREVRLVDDAVLVQRFHDDDLGRGKTGDRLE